MERRKSGNGNKKNEASSSVFWDGLRAELEEAREGNLYRSLRVAGSGSGLLNFSDNDYLGLAHDPRIVQAFELASHQYGVGAGASRLISGTSLLHEQLEKGIAEFKKTERALVFGSGYLANLGAVSALVSEKDLIVIDKLNHASIIDAARLSGATLRAYPHKNLSRLEAILRKSKDFRRRLIITDSVFSMDGDLAPLRELAEIKNAHDAILMVDEAHGIGVFGKSGRGVGEYLDVEDEIDISMGTLSKAVGAMGGFVAGPRELIEYLVNFSRPFIFATALPPPVMAACLESFHIIESAPKLRMRLWGNVREVKQVLLELGFKLGETVSPILPVLTGDEKKALELSRALSDEGIFVPAIRYPTVGKGKARLRLTVSARHTEPDLQRLFTALRRVRKLL
ncbi:MAG TPA: 8-amino-7-oxononanoate synthase [Candidatus Omnitrophota bacterium]|nr:8-amino-7-oxononanoate synthase [Candidatus Omnitrophota bacterium]